MVCLYLLKIYMFYSLLNCRLWGLFSPALLKLHSTLYKAVFCSKERAIQSHQLLINATPIQMYNEELMIQTFR